MRLGMNVALRKPRMTRAEFLDWASTQEARYEFDGFEPVAMTGGTTNHDRITFRIHNALDAKLKGSSCEPLGPNSGVPTIGDAVRYPDVLVTCTKVPGEDRLVPSPVVVFEVLSPTSGHLDRIVKVREYAAVPSVRCYVIVESRSVGLTVYRRATAADVWTATTLTGEDTLRLDELGIAVPVTGLYEGTGLASVGEDATPIAS
jgi:Uma2 family endonuclease